MRSSTMRLGVPLGILAAAAMMLAVYAVSIVPAHAQTPPFSAYGMGLQSGDTVVAQINGKTCGQATADASGQWLLQIPSTAPCSPQDGDTITFTLNGQPTSATVQWKAGGAPSNVAQGIALTASAGGTATATTTSTPAATATGTPSPAGTGNAGLFTPMHTGIAALLALGALAVLGIGGARLATRRR